MLTLTHTVQTVRWAWPNVHFYTFPTKENDEQINANRHILSPFEASKDPTIFILLFFSKITKSMSFQINIKPILKSFFVFNIHNMYKGFMMHLRHFMSELDTLHAPYLYWNGYEHSTMRLIFFLFIPKCWAPKCRLSICVRIQTQFSAYLANNTSPMTNKLFKSVIFPIWRGKAFKNSPFLFEMLSMFSYYRQLL